MGRLAEQVAAEEELLRRLEITKAMVSDVLAGGDDDEVGVVIDPGMYVGMDVHRKRSQIAIVALTEATRRALAVLSVPAPACAG